MAPKCKLRKTWPAIKPKGCKVGPKRHRVRQPAPAPVNRATAGTQTMTEPPPAVRRIAPIPMAPTLTAQLMPIPEGLPFRNTSVKLINAMVERRIRENNLSVARRPVLQKGLKTMRRMARVFGRS
jgi:hypothetical protein